MNTMDEVAWIYDEAKALMVEREKDYQGSWRDEGMGSAIHAAFKKGSQMKTMFESGRWRENIDRVMEDTLDGINYFVFCYHFLDRFKKEKSEQG
jgi:hypothetical protein